MMLASLMFNLPIMISVVRHRSKVVAWVGIGIACVYVAIMGYNRIQMGGHFLSDVCLGVLVTTGLIQLFYAAFLRPFELNRECYERNAHLTDERP